MICRFVATHLLPPFSVTDIVRFRRCRVPINYFVTTWPLAANETHPTSVHTSAMTIVLGERVRITHFMAITSRFAPIRDGRFAPTMHLTLNSSQFCCFLVRLQGITRQKMKGLVVRAFAMKVRPILQHPASSLIVHLSSLCVVSHALPLIDTHKSDTDMAPLLNLTNSNLQWLPLHDSQSYWCFHLTIQFYRGQTSQVSAKTTLLTNYFDGETQCNQHSKSHLTIHQSQLPWGMAVRQ